MTAAEIRSIDVTSESESVKREFALSMAQETAAQLAELNSRLQQAGSFVLREVGGVEQLAASLRHYGSCVPFSMAKRRPTRGGCNG